MIWRGRQGAECRVHSIWCVALMGHHFGGAHEALSMQNSTLAGRRMQHAAWHACMHVLLATAFVFGHGMGARRACLNPCTDKAWAMDVHASAVAWHMCRCKRRWRRCLRSRPSRNSASAP